MVDATNTVLESQNSERVLVLSAPDVAADFMVVGLTLHNGNISGSLGGGLGIVTKLGNVTLRNNYIDNSLCDSGAIYVYGSDTLLAEKNVITNNQQIIGLYISKINTVKLVENIVNQNAGGIYIESTNLVEMERNLITNNSGSNGGGAFIYNGNTVSLKDNIFEGNFGSAGGGGLWITRHRLIS